MSEAERAVITEKGPQLQHRAAGPGQQRKSAGSANGFAQQPLLVPHPFADHLLVITREELLQLNTTDYDLGQSVERKVNTVKTLSNNPLA